jgi:hypothetical protein
MGEGEHGSVGVGERESGGKHSVIPDITPRV